MTRSTRFTKVHAHAPEKKRYAGFDHPSPHGSTGAISTAQVTGFLRELEQLQVSFQTPLTSREQSGTYDPGWGGWGCGILVSANFGRLILGCIEAKFCRYILYSLESSYEICKIYMLLHRSGINISAEIRRFFLEHLENLAFLSRGAIETSEKTKRKINRKNRTEGFRSNS